MPNYADQTVRSNELPPEGRTTATLVMAKLTEAPDKDPTLGVMYTVDSGQTVWQNFTFNDRGHKWVTWQLGIVGTTKHLATMGDISYHVAAIQAYNWLNENKGMTFSAVIGHDEYQGVKRAKLTLKDKMEAFNEPKLGALDETESLPF